MYRCIEKNESAETVIFLPDKKERDFKLSTENTNKCRDYR